MNPCVLHEQRFVSRMKLKQKTVSHLQIPPTLPFPETLHVIRHLSPNLSPTKVLSTQGDDNPQPDSPVSRLAYWKQAISCQPGIHGCHAGTQTHFIRMQPELRDSAMQTSNSPTPEPLTLQDLKAEMRALLVGLGF